MLRRKGTGEIRAPLGHDRRVHKTAAQTLSLLVKADDVHLKAVDHLLGKIEKVDQADNLRLFLAFLLFHLYADNLHRTRQIALHICRHLRTP